MDKKVMPMGRKIKCGGALYSREGIVFAPLLPGEGETGFYAAGRPSRHASGFNRFDLSGIDEFMFERDDATNLTPEYYGITHDFSAIPAAAFGPDKNNRGHILLKGARKVPVKEADVKAGLAGRKKPWSYGYLARKSRALSSRVRRNRRDEALLLVHGCNGSARKTWGRFPELLARAGRYDVFLYNYPTSCLPGQMGIYAGFYCARRPVPYELAAAMEKAVARVLSGYKKVLVLAYGPGCAVAREFILKCGRGRKGAIKIGGALLCGVPNTAAQWRASIRSMGRPVMISADDSYLKCLNRDWKRHVRADGRARQMRPGVSYKLHKGPGINGATGSAGGVRIIEASCGNFISPGGVREDLPAITLQLLSEIMREPDCIPNGPLRGARRARP